MRGDEAAGGSEALRIGSRTGELAGERADIFLVFSGSRSAGTRKPCLRTFCAERLSRSRARPGAGLRIAPIGVVFAQAGHTASCSAGGCGTMPAGCASEFSTWAIAWRSLAAKIAR